MQQTDLQLKDLMKFLDESTCNFWAVKNIASRLENNGYVKLCQKDKWNIVPGGKYYVTQNDSAIFAFVAATEPIYNGFKIITAHSDSPGFRISNPMEKVST